MKQTGNSTNNANLQEFLDSAKNAADYGQRQFFTPVHLAAEFASLLPPMARRLICDLNFGAGHLARACRADTALGLDIDKRVTKELQPPEGAQWRVAQADVTRWYPLAHEAGLTLPFLALNPPFSLQWYAERLRPLLGSDIQEVADEAARHPELIDSTLATLLIAIDRLHSMGEGFMVCNAATARRFLGDPEAIGDKFARPPKPLMRYLHAWLEIPGIVFENQHTAFDTAVLFFSRTKGEGPRFLRAETHTDQGVRQALSPLLSDPLPPRTRFRYDHELSPHGTIQRWDTVLEEYKIRHSQRRPAWNIRLNDKGELRTYLTPFQECSRKLDRTLVKKLHALSGQTPLALCVTATQRTALREAAECGVWTIEPAVHHAIAAALADYEAEGAPFYRPGAIQRLGWVDEHSTLRCIQPGIGAAMPGDTCPIEAAIEATSWQDQRINLAGDDENLEFTGRELRITLTDPLGCKHHFHVRKDDALDDPTREQPRQKVEHGDPKNPTKVTAMHWTAAALAEHFHIPEVKDIADLHPQRYKENLAALRQIEQRVSANLAALATA